MMETGMLTDAAVRKAVKHPHPQRLTDGTGRGTGRLLLMTRPPARPEWYAQYFEDGRKRLTKLGNFPELSLSDARQKFREGAWKAVSPPAGMSVAELFGAYVESLRAAQKRSWEDVEATLSRVAEGIGKQRPANQVTTADVVAMIRPTYEAGKASMADHMRGYVRAAYSWAMKSQSDYRAADAARFGITFNPAALIPAEAKQSGERWLSVDELRHFWHWLAAGGGVKNHNRNLSPLAYKALQLIAVSGQRVEEICRIDRSMVNWKQMTIEWPTTKPGRPHVLPMSTQMAIILQKLKPNDHGLYLPAELLKNSPIRDHTLRVVVGRFCSQEGMTHFTPRDLRRTWKTLSGQVGLNKAERDRLQNHMNSDVASVHYDRYDYLKEKRAAMLRWGRWFEQEIEKPR